MKTLFFVAFLLFAETIFGAEKRSLPCGDKVMPYWYLQSDRIDLGVLDEKGQSVYQYIELERPPKEDVLKTLHRLYEQTVAKFDTKFGALGKKLVINWDVSTENNQQRTGVIVNFFGTKEFIYNGDVLPKLVEKESDLLSQYVPLKWFKGVKKVEVVRIYPGGQSEIASSSRNGAVLPCVYADYNYDIIFISGNNLEGSYFRKFGIKNNFKVYYSDDGSVYELYDENGDLVESTRPEDKVSIITQRYGDLINITITAGVQDELKLEESDDLKSWKEVSVVSLNSENRAEFSQRIEPDKPSRYFRVRPSWRDKN